MSIIPADLMTRLLEEGRIGWGNLAAMDPYVLEREGVKAAYNEAWGARSSASEHRPSSGLTSNITRREGRKGRKAHYTRKAILEREKEEKRRARWLARYPGAPESHWTVKEQNRKTRKQAERAGRRKTSSK
jgi:hypothetical protein